MLMQCDKRVDGSKKLYVALDVEDVVIDNTREIVSDCVRGTLDYEGELL